MSNIDLTIMKKVVCIIAALVISATSIFVMTLRNNHKENMISNNALAVVESNGYYIYYCRCHNDGTCQLGSMISFRPSCGKVVSSEPIEVNCSDSAVNCP